MELRGIVPAIVPAPPPEPFAVQVIIFDWLYREVDGLAEIKMPVLQYIARHRNREVYEYLELTHDVRDSRAAAIYSAYTRAPGQGGGKRRAGIAGQCTKLLFAHKGRFNACWTN